MATLRCIFSISTVASSTKTPTASARPPSVMMLMVSPSTLSSRSEVRIDSGMEMQMISVLRQLPRNTRIMIDVSAAAMRPSRTDSIQRGLHKDGLIGKRPYHQFRGQGGRDGRKSSADAGNDGECGCIAGLLNRQQRASLSILAHDVLLYGVAVSHMRDVMEEDGAVVHGLYRKIVQLLDRDRSSVQSDVVFNFADLGRA